MPGIDARAPDRTLTSSGLAGSPKRLPVIDSTLARPAETNDNRARVYLRLTLSPPGKRTPLMWPGALPTRAPDPLNP